MNCESNEFQTKFSNDLKQVFAKIHPRTFWINVEVTEQIKLYLETNEIGEVICKEGTSTGRVNNYELKKPVTHKSAIWKESSLEDELENMIIDNDKMEEGEEEEEELPPFRLIMNNKTLLKLINYACELQGETSDNVNVSKVLKTAKDDDILGLLSKLTI